MQFVTDPPIPVKIRKMKQRVRWGDPLIANRNIDRTRFSLDDGISDRTEFSFLVIGDTGVGSEQKFNPQRQVAEQMLPHLDTCRFVLHTGDVVYLAGSSEYYLDNFIKPYKEFLVGGDRPEQIAFDRMMFKFPIFPVLGNHDYYDLPFLQGFFSGLTLPLRRIIKLKLDFDLGWHGSFQGSAYAHAFLDCLNRFTDNNNLNEHLDRHYTAQTDTGTCLRYQPEKFTRLPNRYYTFRYGGIDFFALDSNTFNAPQPIPNTSEGDIQRRNLQQTRAKLEQEKLELLRTAAKLNEDDSEDSEELHEIKTKIEQIDEITIDLTKQLETHDAPPIDTEQLDWLQQRLIHSWHTDTVRGRVLFFHHPPYVTEATKWHQAQTLAVRQHLRRVLDNVAKEIGSLRGERPIVDLILNGHAHCLEYIKTLDTGHADSNLNCIVCGGSGYSLRRQRQEGVQLEEFIDDGNDLSERIVARSELFVGRKGFGSKKRRPYSFLRIDVEFGNPVRFVVRPIIVERFHKQWTNSELKSFMI
ncbi:MAG: metallophosphoesterase [Xenococcaceae cyanobacterium]